MFNVARTLWFFLISPIELLHVSAVVSNLTYIDIRRQYTNFFYTNTFDLYLLHILDHAKILTLSVELLMLTGICCINPTLLSASFNSNYGYAFIVLRTSFQTRGGSQHTSGNFLCSLCHVLYAKPGKRSVPLWFKEYFTVLAMPTSPSKYREIKKVELRETNTLQIQLT